MHVSTRERIASAVASFAILAIIVYVLVMGLGSSVRRDGAESLTSIAFDPPAPRAESRPLPPRHVAGRRTKHAASFRNLRNQATQVVAPLLPPLVLQPVIAAPKPGVGAASNTGASDHVGNGQGAGGFGDGNGGGGDGDGDGDYTAPVQLSGDLRMSDLPGRLFPGGGVARLEARYAVFPDGRVGECRVIVSSGIAELDGIACRAIEDRFRYRPSRDEAGRPVRALVERRFTWTLEGSLTKRGGD